jgi:diguanylate cyclase (GGDEF)-like protein
VAVSAEGDPSRASANILLDYLAKRLNVDVAWILNADGNCIASSNYNQKESFIGVNYADRKYYNDAKSGRLGRQYAVGRQTNIPGLYFSAPIIVDGTFVGAAVIKTNLPKLADTLLQPGTFIADSQGVVILTRDAVLTLRTVPAAPVSQLSAEERRRQYMTEDLEPMPIASVGIAGHPDIIYFGGGGIPAIMASMKVPSEGLTLFAVAEIPQISTLQRDRRRLFAATATTGVLLGWVAVGLLMWRKRAEDEINLLAYYDPLTHLPNRRLLLDRLQLAIAASSRTKREGALLFIDLDNFKTLNDTFGHAKGDLFLQQVTQRLTACVREGDTVARLGGDEFVVMLEDLSENPEDAAAQIKIVGEKILTNLNQPYALASQEHHGTASIGATLFGESRNSIDDLLKQADFAMYQAKADGRNTLRFFDPDLQAAVKARTVLEADLRQGIGKDQFLLYYQPQVDGAGRLIGAEALVRWQHPERGIVSPAEFIPLAEETGLILPLGDWVLETACRQMVAWAGRSETAHLTLAVNVSARQFRQDDFVEQVLAVVKRSDADPTKLKLELTESMLLDNLEGVVAKMIELQARGLSFSLDDFGTGYSSLSLLKRLPLRELKIDQSFVRDVLTDSNDATIARTVVALGQSLGLTVIAEGVETGEQWAFLARHGCHAYQGYLFSRPVPAQEFALLLA